MKIVCQRVAAIEEGSTVLSPFIAPLTFSHSLCLSHIVSTSLSLSLSLSWSLPFSLVGWVSWVEIFKSKNLSH